MGPTGKVPPRRSAVHLACRGARSSSLTAQDFSGLAQSVCGRCKRDRSAFGELLFGSSPRKFVPSASNNASTFPLPAQPERAGQLSNNPIGP